MKNKKKKGENPTEERVEKEEDEALDDELAGDDESGQGLDDLGEDSDY